MSNENAAKPDAPNASNAAIDPGILEMGTTVSANDEMRRSIAADITNIDAVCSKLTLEIKEQDGVAAELSKSRKHVDVESDTLLKNAKEAADRILIDEQMMCALAATAEVQMRDTSRATEHGDRATEHGANRATEHGANRASAHGANRPHLVPPSPAQRRTPIQNNENIANLEESVNQFMLDSKNYGGLIEENIEELHDIYASIKADRLKVKLANAKYHNSVLQTDLEDEQKRLQDISTKNAERARRNAQTEIEVRAMVRGPSSGTRKCCFMQLTLSLLSFILRRT
jgi:hypothetical protein